MGKVKGEKKISPILKFLAYWNIQKTESKN